MDGCEIILGTTGKPSETIVGVFTGESINPGFLTGCEMDFVHPLGRCAHEVRDRMAICLERRGQGLVRRLDT